MATVLTPAEIKQKIEDWITTNGNHEITGAHLNTILAAIMDYVGVGYAFMGEAPASAPSPDVPSAYLAAPGTYTNYESGDTVIPEGSIAVLKYDGSAWSKSVIKVCDPVSVSQNTNTDGNIIDKLIIGDTETSVADALTVYQEKVISALGVAGKFDADNPTIVSGEGTESIYYCPVNRGDIVLITGSATYNGYFSYGFSTDVPQVGTIVENVVSLITNKVFEFFSVPNNGYLVLAHLSIRFQNQKILQDKWAVLQRQINETSSKINEKVDISSFNLINGAKLTHGKGLYNGAVTSNSDLCISDYIKTNGKDIISNCAAVGSWGGAVYDKDKNLIRAIRSTTQYTYESGDYYIRLSFYETEDYKRANYGTTLSPYQEYNPIEDYLLDIKRQCNEKVDIASTNLVNGVFLENYMIVANGNIVANNDGHITDFIPVNGKDIISNAFHNNYWGGGAVYDNNKQKIRGFGNTAQYTYEEGDYYVRLSFVKTETEPMANYGTILKDYVPYNPISEYLTGIKAQDTTIDIATGQKYPIGSIESEKTASSISSVQVNHYVSDKKISKRGRRDYFNKNIVAINHDDVSTEDLKAIRKIYNKYGFNANFNYILSVSRGPSQTALIKQLVDDGNDLGLHAFLDESAWMVNKMFDLRPDGTMTFYGDSYDTLGRYILYAMDDKIAGYDLEGNYISAEADNAKSVLEWAEYLYNELVDNTLGYSTEGTAAEKFAADYEGTYPTKAQIIDGDFEGCGHFTKGLFKDCCSCCNYEAWDRIFEVSIAYIRFMYGIMDFTACGPHGARYSSTTYPYNGFTYDDPDHNFLQNGQCKVYSSRLKAWTSFYDTLKRFGIKNCGNYSSPEQIEVEAREGMYFGQKNIRSDFFDRPGLRANYLTLMGTEAHSPYVYTYAEFEAIWGDVDNWLKYAYENAGVEVTKNGVTATICDYIKNVIDRINYCKDTGKIPTFSFDTIWNTPACSVAFELICQYCYENDIDIVPVEKARKLATSLKREWLRNYYPNPAFTQTLLNIFGGSSTALSAYLPDGMRLLSNTGGSMVVSSDGNHRVLSIEGNVSANTKVYALPEGSYKFSVNAKSDSGNSTIKVFKRKVGDSVSDNTSTLVATIDDLTSTFTLKEVSFDIPAPYRVPVDYSNPASIISEGYENNVCIIEVRYFVPADGDLEVYEPKIELV